MSNYLALMAAAERLIVARAEVYRESGPGAAWSTLSHAVSYICAQADEAEPERGAEFESIWRAARGKRKA